MMFRLLCGAFASALPLAVSPSRIRFVLLICLALGFPNPGMASGESEEAEVNFQLGLDAYADGNYSLALSRFLTSNRLAPNPAAAFNIAECYVRKRQYAEAYRWYLVSADGISDARTLRDIHRDIERIKPKVVVYDVTSTPPGVRVYVDSKDYGEVGVTPLSIALPPARSRTFILEKDGYIDVIERGVRGTRGRTIEVTGTLEQIVGTLKLKGTPGAEVHLGAPDGPVVCPSTPCDMQLAPGTRVLYVTSPGMMDGVVQVEIAENQTIENTIELLPKVGSVLVDSLNYGALVEVDGEAVGFTPIVVPTVAVGERTVTVSQPGFQSTSFTVEVTTERQLELTDIELTPLDEVTAVSRRREDISTAPSSVTVLTQAELKAFAYPTVAEALRGVRGFSHQFDSIYDSVSVRGFGGAGAINNRMLVLQDGAILNDILQSQSFVGYEGRVDLSHVGQIEVVRGPGSVLYGSGAVSGVVNLVGEPLERPNESVVELQAHGDVTGVSGRIHRGDGTKGVRASIAGVTSPGRTVFLDPRGPQTDPLNINNFEQFRGGTANARAWLGDLTAQAFYSARAIDIPTGNFGTPLNLVDGNTWIDQRGLFEVRYEPKLGENTTLLARAYANYYRFDSTSRYNVVLSEERLAGASLGGEARILHQPSDRISVQGGVVAEIAPSVGFAGKDVFDNPERPDEVFLDAQSQSTVAAAYAVAEVVPLDMLRFTVGARIDYWSTFGPAVSPRLAVIYTPSDRDVLKLMGGRAFRAPSLYELAYGDDEFQLSPEEAGIALQPEQAISAELEYTHRFSEVWSGLLAAHGSRATDLVELVGADVPGTFVFDNAVQPAWLSGADVELRRAFRGGFMVSGFYSFLYAGSIEGEPLANIPFHNAALKAVVPAIRPTHTLAVRTMLEAPRRINERSLRRTGWSVVTDVVWSGSLKDVGVEYSLGVYNITNAAYALPVDENIFQFSTMLQRPRSIRAKITKSF